MFNEAIPGPFPDTAQCLEVSFTLGGMGIGLKLLTANGGLGISQEFLPLIDKEVAAQRGDLTCPRSHSRDSNLHSSDLLSGLCRL